MLVGFKAMREKFTSRVEKQRPGQIEVHYIDGPMRDLDNLWLFSAAGRWRLRSRFLGQFQLSATPLFESLAGQYFDKAFRKMVAAFEERAGQLYGSSSSSATSAA